MIALTQRKVVARAGGLARSKAPDRPGGNATGSFLATAEMEPKRLGLLHELVSGVSLIGALPDTPQENRPTL